MREGGIEFNVKLDGHYEEIVRRLRDRVNGGIVNELRILKKWRVSVNEVAKYFGAQLMAELSVIL